MEEKRIKLLLTALSEVSNITCPIMREIKDNI
jgi:hypothetical protein